MALNFGGLFNSPKTEFEYLLAGLDWVSTAPDPEVIALGMSKATLKMPQGATICKITLTVGVVDDWGNDLTFKRRSLAGVTKTLGTFHTGMGVNNFTAITDREIENDLYTYWLEFSKEAGAVITNFKILYDLKEMR